MRKSTQEGLKKSQFSCGDPRVTSGPKDVTKLLAAVSAGDESAWDALLAAVYAELRRLAARRMRNERRRHTLQPTALVHEAYLRLCGEKQPRWRSRADFFGAAAEAMRRILVDHARRARAKKRQGKMESVSIDEDSRVAQMPNISEGLSADLEALDQALAKLEQSPRHSEKCTLVKLRYFAGLTLEQAAEALGKSVATVKRDWVFAKAWLYREMTKDERH
ncbi:MAG: sigma-70 family RNA polymerase sigma factor [Phycisphaerae bacterium]|nr:sigma-70 family RNA polymerase sigma factor [Phycisphaerae bacterium]